MARAVDHAPLTRPEKLAAFLAIVQVIDDGGCSPGFARITAEDKHSVDVTFTLFRASVCRAIKAKPDSLAHAERILAEDDSPA